MRFRGVFVCCIISVLVALVSACQLWPGSAADLSRSGSGGSSAALKKAPQLSIPSSTADTDIVAQAKKLGSTPGRVALAVIINRLDSATVVDDMAKKKAKELFDQLSQTAIRNARTLEGLDRQYDLGDILASEKIYVVIQANNVTSRSARIPAKDWIAKFEKALRQG